LWAKRAQRKTGKKEKHERMSESEGLASFNMSNASLEKKRGLIAEPGEGSSREDIMKRPGKDNQSEPACTGPVPANVAHDL
jgi:hypothetical protein